MNTRAVVSILLLIPVSVIAQENTSKAQKSVGPQRSAIVKKHTGARLSPDELFALVSPVVFVVEALDEMGRVVKFGSGVAACPPPEIGSTEWSDEFECTIGARSKISTNTHVVEGAASLRVRQKGSTWPARISHTDPLHDLCVLSVDGLSTQAAIIRRSSDLTVGERVYAIGSPEGLELTLSEGLISGIRDHDNERLVQTTAPISPGSSGGGLFDSQGRLVGITTWSMTQGQTLNFAIPAEVIIDAVRYPPLTGSPTTASGSNAANFYEVAKQAENSQQYEKAVKAFREVLRLNPDDAVLWVRVGHLYACKLQQYADAVSCFEEATRRKPDFTPGWKALAMAYTRLNRHERALPAYQEAVALEPENADVWSLLANTYDALGRHENAIRARENAIRTKPRDATLLYDLGVSYSLSGQIDSAITSFATAVQTDPDFATAWFSLARTYGDPKIRRYQLAIDAFRQVLRLRPACGDVWSELSDAYRNINSYDQAYDALKRAAELHKSAPLFVTNDWVSLAIVAQKLGKKREADDWWKAVRDLRNVLPQSAFTMIQPTTTECQSLWGTSSEQKQLRIQELDCRF